MSGYAWAPGAPFSGDANEVQAELERIARTGGLTPEAILAVARPKRSLLHRLVYNVPPDQAAERYYLNRAQKLIVSIVVRDEEGQPTPVRYFVREATEGGREYVSVRTPGARETAIRRLRRDIEALATQLRALEMYPELLAALEEALAA